MNETYKKIILGGLSVAIVAGTYFLGVKPLSEDTKAIKSETQTLKTTLADLQAKEVNRQQYLEDTAENYAMFDEKLGEFPSNLNQEYQIEFVQAIRDNENIDYNVTTQSMAKETAFYILGGAGAETNVVENGETDGAVTSENYECYTSTMVFSYEGDYKGIKSFVDYVAAYPYRMTIDNVTVSNSGDGDMFTGSMSVNIYCIKGKDREENMQLELDDIETGVDNLFAGGNTSISKFAEDNGASIVNDYDIVLMLNPTTSDTSGKALSLKSGGTSVTSNRNESEAVSISVSKKDGQYVAEYAIGSDKQTQEFEPGEDLTILIQSSDIKDASDLNGARVSLENTTDMPLYVKIAGDDTAQRVKIVSRAGSISVYK